MMQPGSKLLTLLDSVLSIWTLADSPDCGSSVSDEARRGAALEEEVDTEVERLVTELETTLEEIIRTKPGAASAINTDALEAYSPLREQVMLGAAASPGMQQGCAHQAMPPSGSPISSGSEGFEQKPRNSAYGRTAGQPDSNTQASRDSRGSHPAQVALHCLGLDDEWPTELTRGEIRRRYMREALNSHPDKGPPEEKEWRTAKFQYVSDAYSTLEVYIAVLERIRGNANDSEVLSETFATCATSPAPARAHWDELEVEEKRLALGGEQLSIEAGPLAFATAPASIGPC